jgi:bacterioferritin (cytochrome b1)
MSDREQALAALNAAFCHKYHSMAQYVLDARPYVRPGQERMLSEIAEIAAEERAAADRLAETIEKLEGIPQVGIFNPEVANFNYLSLDHLLGVLTRSLEEQLARDEAARPLLEDLPASRRAMEELCKTTRNQLSRLRRMAAAE